MCVRSPMIMLAGAPSHPGEQWLTGAVVAVHLSQAYMQPLKKSKVMAPAEIRKVFGNLEQVRTINKSIFEKLESRFNSNPNSEKVADLFLEAVRSQHIGVVQCRQAGRQDDS